MSYRDPNETTSRLHQLHERSLAHAQAASEASRAAQVTLAAEEQQRLRPPENASGDARPEA